VLEDVYKHRRPDPGTLSILAAMGPGFCSELVLLRW
ncbi:MAG TPA: type III polyketide synthase, partial [Verrucomicrobiae bacterium]|nr:type III polyketide synthase [Verrucomicrobiae bacterium]